MTGWTVGSGDMTHFTNDGGVTWTEQLLSRVLVKRTTLAGVLLAPVKTSDPTGHNVNAKRVNGRRTNGGHLPDLGGRHPLKQIRTARTAWHDTDVARREWRRVLNGHVTDAHGGK